MKKLTLMAAAGLLSVSNFSQAAQLDIEVQNLTQGIYFTPLLLLAHNPENSLFETGEAASTELQAMAEGGSIDGLMTVGETISANMQANPAGGLLGPGMSTSTTIMNDDGNTVLSIVGMMLPTNDGFVGLDNWNIPSEAGTYTVYLNAYDAGTEANDELRGGGAPGEPGMPVPPPLDPLLGSGGEVSPALNLTQRFTSTAETSVMKTQVAGQVT